MRILASSARVYDFGYLFHFRINHCVSLLNVLVASPYPQLALGIDAKEIDALRRSLAAK
jgi:hypothetical protein